MTLAILGNIPTLKDVVGVSSVILTLLISSVIVIYFRGRNFELIDGQKGF